MKQILFPCEHCAELLSAPEELIGQLCECQDCGERVLVPQPAVTLTCASCGAPMGAAGLLAGNDVECPACGVPLHVPQAAAPAIARTVLHAATPAVPASAALGSHFSRREVPKVLIIAMASVIGILIIAAVALVWMLTASRHLPVPPISTPIDVRLDRPAPPAPKPAALTVSRVMPVVTPAVTSSVVAAVAVPSVAAGLDSDPHAGDMFSDYETCLRKGLFGDADARLRDLLQVAGTRAALESFLATRLPSDQRRTLVVQYPCDACENGTCAACVQKPGVCTACKGHKQCPKCGGVSVRKQRCMDCLCTTCRGTGKCSKCHGWRKYKCERCGGSGFFMNAMSTPCPRCNGSGQRPGLKRGDGKAGDPLRCVSCKGTGKQIQDVRTECADCKGAGTIPCGCGDGLCHTCQGKGRQPTCKSCASTGYFEVVCTQCQGSGKCDLCGGVGRCPVCHGTGVCPRCEKTGLVAVYTLPVNAAWLKVDAGVVVFDGGTTRVLKPGEATGALSLSGRPIQVQITPVRVVCIGPRDQTAWIVTHVLR